MTPVSPIMHTYFRNHNVAITLRHAQSSPNMVATMALRYVLRAAIALREVQQLPYVLLLLPYIGYSGALRHAQSLPNMVVTMALRYVLRAAIALREVRQQPYVLLPLSYIRYSRCLTSRAVIALMVMADRDSKQSA